MRWVPLAILAYLVLLAQTTVGRVLAFDWPAVGTIGPDLLAMVAVYGALHARLRADAMLAAMTRYAGLAATGDNYLDPRLEGWAQQPALWEMARRLLAEEVNEAVHPGVRSQELLLAQRLAWKQFGEENYRIDVERVRTRVAPLNEALDRSA